MQNIHHLDQLKEFVADRDAEGVFVASAYNHIECVRHQIANLQALALDMGRVIRLLDEAGAHSELWTQDGDYLIDGRFPK